jgi:hypothetical protein
MDIKGILFASVLLALILAGGYFVRGRRWSMAIFLLGVLILLGILFGVVIVRSPSTRLLAFVIVVALWLVAGYIKLRSRPGAVLSHSPGEPAPLAAPNQNADSDIQEIVKQARSGSAEAQFQLAGLYDNGRGVPQDHAQAFAWCQKAADQGLAEAQYWLGKKYLSGEGIPADKNKAVSYLKKAADQGIAEAREVLLRFQV